MFIDIKRAKHGEQNAEGREQEYAYIFVSLPIYCAASIKKRRCFCVRDTCFLDECLDKKLRRTARNERLYARERLAINRRKRRNGYEIEAGSGGREC